MPARNGKTVEEFQMRMPIDMLKSLLAKAVIFIAAAVTVSGALRPAAAETWPARPVTIVLPFAAGSMIDFVARALANDLSQAIGQPVVVESRPGGGGIVAGAYVAKAPPDGYTLLMTAVGPAVLRPLMDKSVGYDTDADFTPVILVGEAPNVLLASPKLGVSTVKELLDHAKKNGGKISIGHSGPGTMGHLCSILFAHDAGLDATLISYRGTGPMMVDVLGGQIDAGFPAYNPATKSAKILAVTAEQRVEFLADVTTMKESGFDVVGGTWEAIFGPAHIPPEIVAKLNSAMDSFLRKPETHTLFGETGFQVFGGPPARVTERVARDRAKWAPIIENAKISIDK
jgi:tripartite-type tricarboxylate transporter receptor subunit TctC